MRTIPECGFIPLPVICFILCSGLIRQFDLVALFRIQYIDHLTDHLLILKPEQKFHAAGSVRISGPG